MESRLQPAFVPPEGGTPARTGGLSHLTPKYQGFTRSRPPCRRLPESFSWYPDNFSGDHERPPGHPPRPSGFPELRPESHSPSSWFADPTSPPPRPRSGHPERKSSVRQPLSGHRRQSSDAQPRPSAWHCWTSQQCHPTAVVWKQSLDEADPHIRILHDSSPGTNSKPVAAVELQLDSRSMRQVGEFDTTPLKSISLTEYFG